MSREEPTPEDLDRDPAEDMKVCDLATRGPWTMWHEKTEDDQLPYRQVSVTEEFGPPHVIPPHFDAGYCVSDKKRFLDDAVRVEDMEFIALARAALPAWIRRAVAAEAELARLRGDSHVDRR